MKVGDELYCYKVFYLIGESEWFTIGKIYTIISIDDEDEAVFLIDDDGDRNAFSIKNNTWKYFGDYFYTNTVYRKEKLKKLNFI